MSRQILERWQVFVYLAAILVGLLYGYFWPHAASLLEAALWPVLALLLYTTFTQVPLTHLRDALLDTRFLLAAVIGNFGALPLVVWGLLRLAPQDPAVQLGVLMVLLVPCTDWFITFARLGGGNTTRAITFSPISLLLQMLLFPAYLWIFNVGVSLPFIRTEMLGAFVGLILLPLCAAFLTEQWVNRDKKRAVWAASLAWLPVPLLAVVVFLIAASQVGIVMGAGVILVHLAVIFTAFLFVAGILAKLVSSLFALPTDQGRVLAFSFGTRNSFVVLPLALALPEALQLAVVVIVLQSLVELFGMVFYLWWVPKRLFPIKTGRTTLS